MRLLDKEITDPRILEEILNNSQICRLGFAIDNIPHIVPVNFGYKNNTLFIHSATAGNKIDMIGQNDYVCFEMELYNEVIKATKACSWTTKYRSIIGWGKISIVKDKERKIAGLDVIMSKYGGGDYNEYDEKVLEKTVVLEIAIDKLTGKQSGRWE